MSNQLVFIALQSTDDNRPVIDAIEADNPHATVHRYPAMVKIDAPGRLEINRATIEDLIGRTWDMQELQLGLISLAGNIEETEDQFVLAWR
ncbi:monooxygenase [Massilia sp. Root133]|uniref:Monooxygenase n=1 Tax=Massilia cellulosiltytica TaxID=2683234 RepID=A0A7X3FWX2_9BURK|nr:MULTISPECIES: MmoB/DmpM family protein [unclassified Massilia]KQX98293.1 monooxygenase [Massilia sp. Root133]KQZ46977.1 monooxygenase [Massilia sp. Root1485]MVW59550.1 monooxygenase [Telluria cellulosilytica]